MADQHAQEVQRRLALALAAAEQMGQVAMRLYQSDAMSATRKADGSVVTSADKDAETLLREMIARAFPDDAILGEEFGESGGKSGFRWVIDPIDGTRSFVDGIPTFANLVAVEFGGRAVAGVANFPALSECVWASDGNGAQWRSRQGLRTARMAAAVEMNKAMVQTASPQSYARHGKVSALDRIAKQTLRTHGWNDAYSFALTATGRSHATVAFGFSRWDVAPFEVIFAEAGGQLTDWSGKGPALATALGTSRAMKDVFLELLA
jgi:histidinol phosphatase-like enzyme (inositol monophosphatase family)